MTLAGRGLEDQHFDIFFLGGNTSTSSPPSNICHSKANYFGHLAGCTFSIPVAIPAVLCRASSLMLSSEHEFYISHNMDSHNIYKDIYISLLEIWLANISVFVVVSLYWWLGQMLPSAEVSSSSHTSFHTWVLRSLVLVHVDNCWINLYPSSAFQPPYLIPKEAAMSL